MPPRMKAAAGGMRMRRATSSKASTTAINSRMSSKRETVLKRQLAHQVEHPRRISSVAMLGKYAPLSRLT